jgi:hypothetical protein
MATCAIAKPEIKFMSQAPMSTPNDSRGPGPAMSSGSTNIPAPTVFPVIIREAETTGMRNVSKKEGCGIPSKALQDKLVASSTSWMRKSDTDDADKLLPFRLDGDKDDDDSSCCCR